MSAVWHVHIISSFKTNFYKLYFKRIRKTTTVFKGLISDELFKILKK